MWSMGTLRKKYGSGYGRPARYSDTVTPRLLPRPIDSNPRALLGYCSDILPSLLSSFLAREMIHPSTFVEDEGEEGEENPRE